MDRQTIYAGQIPLETDLLNTNKNTMVALAKLAAAMFGTATVVNGLACVPTAPAGLTVNVNPGEMYSLVATDATAHSSLAADSHTILKQGIVLDAVNLSCPAPGTAGQSVNFLIQATYQDSDSGSVVLPYYNASNPTQAWSGPGNNGTAQPTVRKGIVTLSAKAGIAATTGSQTTPAPDAGYTGLWVVTVANGQTQITAPNIVQATNAPILPSDLLHAIQASSLTTGVDTGAANVCVVNYSYPVQALKDTMPLWFKAAAANTGATTLNVNGLGAQPIVGAYHQPLQGGEIVANGKCQVVWNATINSFVLVACSGGAQQVAPATAAYHAVNQSQAFTVGQVMTSVIGSRALNTTYTNSTGKAITVEVWVSLAAGQTITVVKGGVSSQAYGNAAAGAVSFSVFSIVLPGQTYQITTTGGTTLTAWNEIR